MVEVHSGVFSRPFCPPFPSFSVCWLLHFQLYAPELRRYCYVVFDKKHNSVTESLSLRGPLASYGRTGVEGGGVFGRVVCRGGFEIDGTSSKCGVQRGGDCEENRGGGGKVRRGGKGVSWRLRTMDPIRNRGVVSLVLVTGLGLREDKNIVREQLRICGHWCRRA